MVTFKELLQQVKYENVEKVILKFYPDEKNNVEAGGYREVFEELLDLKPKFREKKWYIVIRKIIDEDGFYYDVSGKPANEEQLYGLEYTPWEEWLGFYIDSKNIPSDFTKEDIVAHCLWEMTWCGFSQDEIQKRIKEIEREIERIESGEEKTYTLEEIWAEEKEG